MSSGLVSILSWYGVARPEDTIDGSLEDIAEERGFLPRTSGLLVRACPDWLSIPMFLSKDIVGKVGWSSKAIDELLKNEEEKDNLFANFPIGTTMQNGGKRKEAIE